MTTQSIYPEKPPQQHKLSDKALLSYAFPLLAFFGLFFGIIEFQLFMSGTNPSWFLAFVPFGIITMIVLNEVKPPKS